MNLRVNLEHELDVSWILALWFAIHGGDPSPEGGVLEVSEETYRLANGLVENLLTTYAPYGVRVLSHTELETQLRTMVGMQTVSPSHVSALPSPLGGGGGGTPTGGGGSGGGGGGDGPTGPEIGPGGVPTRPNCWQSPFTKNPICVSVISRSIEPGLTEPGLRA